MADLIVVGGGAAGMMAALFAARAGARVTLLERNEKLGKKVYITGKGRCNLTNTASPDQFMASVVRNPRFLYAALSTLNADGLQELFESLGVPLKTERGGRVFPASDRASDITRALERALREQRVMIRLNSRVSSLIAQDGRVGGVIMESGEAMAADRVIVATGGASYPTTGSTGDGWALAESVGHAIRQPLPALSSIETVETWPFALSGLTLKNVALSATSGGKRIYSEQGELLLTHFGISGPLALTLSSYLPEQPGGTQMAIDLKPALTDEVLDRRLLRDFEAASRRQISSVMDGLAPHNLGLAILELTGISPAQPLSGVTQAMRRALIGKIKALPLTVRALRGMNEAIITRGGVATREINPSTMESKLLAGLYFAGEMIDVDALTGGFNLQIAFSTGALAGKSAAAAEGEVP